MSPSLPLCFVPQAYARGGIVPYQEKDTVKGPIQPFMSQHRQKQRPTFLAMKTDEEILTEVREELLDQEGTQAVDSWDACIQLVEGSTGMDPDEAEMCLAKAFGWRGYVVVTSKLARKYMKTSLPEATKLQESMDWLTSALEPLSLSESQLRIAILERPEVYLLDPASTYEKALEVAPEQYQDPEKFRELALKDKAVLGLTYNCRSDGCNSNCGNCWQSTEYN